MCECVCVCVCVCVFIYIYIYVCVCVCMCLVELHAHAHLSCICCVCQHKINKFTYKIDNIRVLDVGGSIRLDHEWSKVVLEGFWSSLILW